MSKSVIDSHDFHVSKSVSGIRNIKDEESAEAWAKVKVEAGQNMSQGQVGMTVIHQWRWDSASLWLAGCNMCIIVCQSAKLLQSNLSCINLKLFVQ